MTYSLRSMRRVVLAVCLLMCVCLVETTFAQTVTIGEQTFDGSNTLGITRLGTSLVSGNSAAADAPATSPLAISGNAASLTQAASGTAIVFDTMTSAAFDTRTYTGISFSMRLASFSIGLANNGADNGTDMVVVAIDPGTGTFSTWITVKGPASDNASWAYTASGAGSVAYGTTAITLAPGGSGLRTTDGYGTLTITGLPAITGLRIRVTARNNSFRELWAMDNLTLTGTNCAIGGATLASQTLTSGGTPTFATDALLPATNTAYKITSALITGSVTGYTVADRTGIAAGALIEPNALFSTSTGLVRYTITPYFFGANGIDNGGAGDDCLNTAAAITRDAVVGPRPGNAGNDLKLWLRADAGLSAGTWNNQIANGNATAAGTTSVLTNAINFNPVAVMNNVGAYTGTLTNGLSSPTGASSSFFVGFLPTAGATSDGIVSLAGTGTSDAAGTGGAMLFYHNNATSVATYRAATARANATSNLVDAYQLFQTDLTGAGGQNILYKGGATVSTVAFSPQPAFAAARFAVGTRLGATIPSTTNYFNGNIAEAIVYNTLLSATDAAKVQTYLGLKYSIPLKLAAYLNGSGGTIWDSTANTGYNNNIIGIGAEAATGLAQPKSKQQGNTQGGLALTTASLPDGVYLIGGSNNAGIVSLMTAQDAPAGVYLSQRGYRVQATGAAGSVTYGFQGFTSTDKLYMVIDTDNDGLFADETAQPLVWNAATGNLEVNATIPAGATRNIRLAFPPFEGMTHTNANTDAGSSYFTLPNTQIAYAYLAAGESLTFYLRKFSNNGGTYDADMRIKLIAPDGAITTNTITGANAAGTQYWYSGLTSATSGVWTLEMEADTGASGYPRPDLNGSQIEDRYEWGTQVFSAGGAVKLGRVYTSLMAFANTNTGFVTPFGFYHHSETGYRYKSVFRKYNGLTSFISTNSSGVVYNNTCNPFYKSVGGAANGAAVDPLATGSFDGCNPFKQYFNAPDPTMPAMAPHWDTASAAPVTDWLYSTPASATIVSLSFETEDTTTTPWDGTVSLETTNFSSNVRVQIDANNDGDYIDLVDREIFASIVDDTGSVYFDGLDGLGNPIPINTGLKINGLIDRRGEIHFTLRDVEALGGGLEVVRLNGPVSPNMDLLYWNDTSLTGFAGCSPTPTTNGLAGIPSTGGVHGWDNVNTGGSAACSTSSGWGNTRYIDNWTYGIGAGVNLPTANLPTDFGDAPVSYGAPKHTFNGTLGIGALLDNETKAKPSANATYDDTRGAGPDDEDGVTGAFPALNISTTTYAVNVAVRNTTGSPATLSGWIDFNRNGTFETGERAQATVASGATTATLNWAGLSGISGGISFVRLRMATLAAEVANPTGTAATGEVEDDSIHIVVPIAGTVFNDANGSVTLDGTETNTDAGGTLYMNLVNDLGAVVASAPVQPDGSYLLYFRGDVTGYQLVLATTPTATTPSLPAGWVFTGEQSGSGNSAIQSATPGMIDLTLGTAGVSNAAFGIERTPNSNTATANVAYPGTGTYRTLNGVGSNPAPPTGNDPEDGTYTGLSGTRSVVLDTTGMNGNRLLYNGAEIGDPTTIPNFNAALLQVQFIGTNSTGLAFRFAYVDAAGVQDPTPAVYALNWNIALPVVLKSFVVEAGEACGATLLWETANEDGIAAFAAEMSTDGNRFEEVGRVAAQYGMGGGGSYRLAVARALEGRTFFRLRMMDADGTHRYSPVADYNSPCENHLTLQPNPSASDATLTGLQTGMTVRVTDLAGRLLYEATATGKALQLPASQWPAGVCLVQVRDASGKVVAALKLVRL